MTGVVWEGRAVVDTVLGGREGVDTGNAAAEDSRGLLARAGAKRSSEIVVSPDSSEDEVDGTRA